MALCRARLNVTVQKVPAAQLGGKDVSTMVSQWPATGSRVPVGSNVVSAFRRGEVLGRGSGTQSRRTGARCL